MLIHALPQLEETPLQEETTEIFTCRYSYFRAKEAQELDEGGQDFLAFQVSGNRFIFALCDGVGMSFHGEIAARFLGTKLLKLFETCLDKEQDFSNFLYKSLQDWEKEAMEEVKAFQLPRDTPWLLRDVLEEKRNHGSESMFIGGTIEVIPNRDEVNVMLVAHGDSFLQLFQENKKCFDLIEYERNTENRWSTHRGILGGELKIISKTLARKEANRLVIHSDGLMPLLHYNFEEVTEEIKRAQSSPTSDDISFLDISW
ncbi:protein phosphatase 2C domain-containing protein [Bacillus sp. XF8]|uniref:PPM-type phosphatase domain-containing protein n=1 Tax=Bacillus bingmayongensis TaxID=1150157 RepID=A0ABU5K3M5_9BACI|nr:protein phosphatase 2C domain-containing protein [Bacillus sp. XF8]MBO1580141.1 hypothetical protein [Bacillus sp. XF8]MDZ5610322.1 hypothetical protein [Bacillus pseudomycoides]